MGSQKCQSILVEIDASTQVDNHVIPICLDYIIQNNLLRSSRQPLHSPALAILTTDQPPETYYSICKKCSAPTESVLDAYSCWYPLSDNQSDAHATLFHISDLQLSHDSLDTAVETLLIHSGLGLVSQSDIEYDKEKVIVIDSLSSITRFIDKPSVWVTLLMQKLSTHSSNSSVIVTVRCEELDNHKSTIDSLKRLMDTHVKVYQIAGDDALSDKVVMRVTRRRASGRVVIEGITGRYDERVGGLVDVESKVVDKEKDLKVAEEVDLGEQLSQRGLTFRVSLSSKEREMRAKAGLPYVHQDEALADQALELHPKELQVDDEDTDEDELYEDEESQGGDHGDGEELFSEDV